MHHNSKSKTRSESEFNEHQNQWTTKWNTIISSSAQSELKKCTMSHNHVNDN